MNSSPPNNSIQNQSKNAKLRLFIPTLLLALLLITLEILNPFQNFKSPLESLESGAIDLAFRLGNNALPNENIIIVAIDDESLGWVNKQWPWPRTEYAKIIDWLNDAGAKVIGIDIFLFEPSNNAFEDEILAKSLSEANSIVTVNQIFKTEFSNKVNIPDNIFRPHIKSFGITEVIRDDDAIARGVRGYEEFNGENYYNWAFLLASAYLDIEGPKNPSVSSLEFNNYTVPLNEQNKLIINYAGSAHTYPYYSAAFIPLGDYDNEKNLFKDKIVIIGATSETLQDIYPTPYSSTRLTPGVELVANTLSTILTENYLSMSPPIVTIAIILVMVLIIRLILMVNRPIFSFFAAVIGIIIYLSLRQYYLSSQGLILAIVPPLLMFSGGIILSTLGQAVTLEIEKRKVRGLFNRFISPEMVSQLINTQDINSLNKRTELTILFSDIRGFTSISEKLSPDELVNLLNPYLEVMTKIIHKNGGTVDKYEGDAIVAFFGEPIPYEDHAIRAAKASLEMREALRKLTDQWKVKGIYKGVFEMGIGLNTGEVFVGLLGSEQRINYTIIGDAANLASRLQDQTKEYNWPIIISGKTYTQIKTNFEAEFIGTKLLKGKSESVDIYKLIRKRISINQ